MSSSDNDPKKAEEMSLSELLGSSHAADAPTSIQEDESDDDKSGLINLAQMVQAVSQPPQNRPAPAAYSAPPQQGMPPQTGHAMPASGAYAAAPPAQAAYPTAPATNNFGQSSFDQGNYADIATPKKKNTMLFVVIAAVAVIGGGVGAFLGLSGGDKTDTDSPVASVEQPVTPPATTPIPAAVTEPAAANTADGTTAAADDEGDDADYEITEEEVDDGKGGKQRRRVRRAKPRTTAASSTSVAAAPAKTTPVVKESAPVAATPEKKATKTSELDSLLSGGGKSSGGDSGGLPEKPSRDQVQSAMSKVVSQARSVCSKSGSGQVSVRIIVGSNGVVRDAIPTGEHAADSLGRCVATFARRTARLPAFKANTFTFTYPFNI